jgi:hypothetical protein
VCWTGFGTGGHYFHTDLFALPYRLVYAVKTKGAFLNHTMHPVRKRPDTPVGTVGRKVRAVILLFLWLLIVKTPDSIGTGDNTILAAYAPPEVLYHNPILTLIGCLGRAYHYTRGIIAVHAWHRDKVNA